MTRVLVALGIGAVTALLMVMSRTGIASWTELRSYEHPLRLLLIVGLVSVLQLWGFWSWRKVVARCHGPKGRVVFRAGVLGFGGLMLLVMSVEKARQHAPGTWTTTLSGPTFLADVLSYAFFGWPIWLWAGYWYGALTLGATDRLTR